LGFKHEREKTHIHKIQSKLPQKRKKKTSWNTEFTLQLFRVLQQTTFKKFKWYIATLGLRGDEVTGKWRRLHNEELNDLYSSPNIVWVIKLRMRWAGHVAHMGEKTGVYRVLLGKPEGKRPLERPKHRWVDNIRTDFQEVGCGYMDWIRLAQDGDRWRMLVSAAMNLRVS